MNLIALGQSDLRVSPIALGTMTFGEQNSETEAHAQLDRAASFGINFIDTAEMYPVPPRAATVHRTEEIIGRWLCQQPRDRWVIATKATGPARGLDWIRDGDLRFQRRQLRLAVDGSLRRLRCETIDLYQLHWPERNVPMFGSYLYDPAAERPATPIEQSLEVLAELINEGKIRYVGLSNEWPWGVMQALQAARELNLPRIVTVQNAYSLLNRTWESAMLELCHREAVSLLAYSPLAFGHLTAKYLRDPAADGRINQFPGFGQRYGKPAVQPAVAAYAELAASAGLTPTQLALAFVYRRWFVASTIIGATTLAQLEENLAAFAVNWTAELEQAVEALHLRYFNPAP
jgi:aryl-alcohol dehydrogenase-like predicted oxidoreductase